MITQKNMFLRDLENNENNNIEADGNEENLKQTQIVLDPTAGKNKTNNESKQQKKFIIKKKQSLKKGPKQKKDIKKDEFYDHFNEIIQEIEKEENDSFNAHQSDEYEEGRSDSESSSDDLEVLYDELNSLFMIFCL